MKQGIKIVGTGRALPKKAVSNDMMSNIVDTSDEWISSRTGIKNRYFCEDETGVSLAVASAQKALENAGISADEIGIIITATITPDFATPSTACMVQNLIGAPADTMAFDLGAACSGFVYGLEVLNGLLPCAVRPYALLIGCEVFSRVLDFTDRGTCVIFGDAAAAAVVKYDPDSPFTGVYGARGDCESLYCPGPGSKEPQTLYMNGKEIFRFAVDIVPKCINRLLDRERLTHEDIDFFVCHQANARIISYVAEKMNIPAEKFYVNIDRYGNTSAATIPLVLDEMNEQGLLKPGAKIMLVGFGSGLTWGACLTEW